MSAFRHRLGNDDAIPMIPPVVPDIRVGILSEIQDYNHELVNAPEAWRTSMGSGVRVAVLDTGIPDHPDITVCGGKGFDKGSDEDLSGHATAVGSVIAATAGNGMGIRGVAPECEDWYGGVLDRYGTGTVKTIVDGIYWAVDEAGADIVNMSLGIPGEYDVDPELERACEYAVSKDVALFAAAGNNGRAVNHPARYESVMAVAAIDRYGDVADFSARGPEIEFAAGGVDVYMCYRDGGYASMSGTSFSCPVVAGVACLVKSIMRSAGVDLTPDEVRQSLKRIAFDVGPKGVDELTGNGVPVFTKDAANLLDGGKAPKLARQSFWRRLWNAILMLSAKAGNGGRNVR